MRSRKSWIWVVGLGLMVAGCRDHGGMGIGPENSGEAPAGAGTHPPRQAKQDASRKPVFTLHGATSTGPRVGVLAYCADLTGSVGAENAAKTLQADGRFGSVTVVDGDVVQPSTQYLLDNFDVVIASTDNRCGSTSTVLGAAGTILADYAKAGRGLVITTFGFSGPGGIGFGADLFAEGLSPFQQAGVGNGPYNVAFDLTNASTAPACTRMLDGVTSPVKSEYTNHVNLSSGATACTKYENANGLLALAINANGNVTGFNSFPFSATDNQQAAYRRLLGNIVLEVAHGGNSPPTITSMGGPYISASDVAVTFNGTAEDPDGDALTYSWTFRQIRGAAPFSGAILEGQSPSLAFDANGKYEATLTVSDGKGGTASASETVSIGHEIVVSVASPFGVNGVVVTTARTNGADGTGETYVQQTDETGKTSFFLSDGGWIFHAKNLEDRGEKYPNTEYYFAVTPLPDAQRALNTSSSHSKDRRAVIYDYRNTRAITLTPANYEAMTADPFPLSGGGTANAYNLRLNFEEGGAIVSCSIRDEDGSKVSVSNTENMFVVLPFRDGAKLPPLPPLPVDDPALKLQRGILLGATTLQSDGDCNDLAGLPSTVGFDAAPVLETNRVSITTSAGPKDVVFVKPFQVAGSTASVTVIAEPPRVFLDYIKDEWGDNQGIGDIGLVSYGWEAKPSCDHSRNDCRNGVFTTAGHVRGDSEYTLHLRYYLNGKEQSIRVTVAWRDNTWEVLEQTPSRLPAGVEVAVTGFAEGSGAGLEGTAIWKVKLPTEVAEDAVELRVTSGEGGRTDAAPDRGFRKVVAGYHTWNTLD